jgi:hypothetical protein
MKCLAAIKKEFFPTAFKLLGQLLFINRTFCFHNLHSGSLLLLVLTILSPFVFLIYPDVHVFLLQAAEMELSYPYIGCVIFLMLFPEIISGLLSGDSGLIGLMDYCDCHT